MYTKEDHEKVERALAYKIIAMYRDAQASRHRYKLMEYKNKENEK